MYSVYSTETGLFTGQQLAGPADFVAANTPHGHAVLPGAHDHLCRRVHLASGTVQPWQPPPPPATDWHAWQWSEAAERWQPQPTLLAQRQARVDAVQRAIEAEEAQQARPLRELAVAAAAGAPTPTEAAQRLAELEGRITALRSVGAALAAAQTQQALDAVVWP